jgi:hypothetical protein
MTLTDAVLRAALEERIAFGPETRRPLAERLRARLPGEDSETLALALGEAQRAVTGAEALARECVAGYRTQAEVVAELCHQFPWLTSNAATTGPRRAPAARRDGTPDLADRLGHFGYYLAIM